MTFKQPAACRAQDGGRVTLDRLAAPASSMPSFAGIHAGERPPLARPPLRHKHEPKPGGEFQTKPSDPQTPRSNDSSQRPATYIDAESPRKSGMVRSTTVAAAPRRLLFSHA